MDLIGTNLAEKGAPYLHSAGLAARLIGQQAAGGPATLGVWHHTPMHRQIGFTTGEGSIDHFELRCSWQHFSASAQPGKVWTIPEAWGVCSVFVFAAPGTAFDLIEYGPNSLPDL